MSLASLENKTQHLGGSEVEEETNDTPGYTLYIGSTKTVNNCQFSFKFKSERHIDYN